MCKRNSSPTPGAGLGIPSDDHQRHPLGPALAAHHAPGGGLPAGSAEEHVLTHHGLNTALMFSSQVSYDSPLKSPGSTYTISLRGYVTLGQYAGDEEVLHVLTVVDEYQVLLAIQLGLSIHDFIEKLYESSGFTVLHVRDEYSKFDIDLDIDSLLRSRAFKQATNKT